MIHFIRFNLVGVIGFALQSAALFVLTHNAHPLGYLAATAAAVELAVLNNFIWHQRWTWKDRPSATTGETLHRLLKFNIEWRDLNSRQSGLYEHPGGKSGSVDHRRKRSQRSRLLDMQFLSRRPNRVLCGS